MVLLGDGTILIGAALYSALLLAFVVQARTVQLAPGRPRRSDLGFHHWLVAFCGARVLTLLVLYFAGGAAEVHARYAWIFASLFDGPNLLLLLIIVPNLLLTKWMAAVVVNRFVEAAKKPGDWVVSDNGVHAVAWLRRLNVGLFLLLNAVYFGVVLGTAPSAPDPGLVTFSGIFFLIVSTAFLIMLAGGGHAYVRELEGFLDVGGGDARRDAKCRPGLLSLLFQGRGLQRVRDVRHHAPPPSPVTAWMRRCGSPRFLYRRRFASRRY